MSLKIKKKNFLKLTKSLWMSEQVILCNRNNLIEVTHQYYKPHIVILFLYS